MYAKTTLRTSAQKTRHAAAVNIKRALWAELLTAETVDTEFAVNMWFVLAHGNRMCGTNIFAFAAADAH